MNRILGKKSTGLFDIIQTHLKQFLIIFSSQQYIHILIPSEFSIIWKWVAVTLADSIDWRYSSTLLDIFFGLPCNNRLWMDQSIMIENIFRPDENAILMSERFSYVNDVVHRKDNDNMI